MKDQWTTWDEEDKRLLELFKLRESPEYQLSVKEQRLLDKDRNLLSYDEILERQNIRRKMGLINSNNHAAPADAHPARSKGFSWRHEYWKKVDNGKIVARAFRDNEKYQPNKYFACVQCGGHVGKNTRRLQKNKLVPRKGYQNLLCKFHYGVEVAAVI